MNILSCIDFTAIATIIIAIFTGLLWYSNIKLWKTTAQSIELIAQSIELTKQEFITSHPPKLRVHSISLYRHIEIGKEWEIKCFITNIGVNAATIRESNLTFKRLDRLPALLPFSDKSHMLAEKPIECGESIIGKLTLDKKTADNLNLKMWGKPRDGKNASPFYFFGYIDYLDGSRTTRRTAFCRQFNIETERFTMVEDEDHECSY